MLTSFLCRKTILPTAFFVLIIFGIANTAGATLSSTARSAGNQSAWNGTWLSASPSLLGFESFPLEMAVDKLGRMEGVYSILVVRNGILVVEHYFREASRTKPHNLKSASKSVLSGLIGIAVDKGLLELNQPITDFLPLKVGDKSSGKNKITIRHLLTMTSGLQTTSYQQYNSWIADKNWVKTALGQPLTTDPGTTFQYSTGNTHLLSALLTAASGKSTLDFAVENLFTPLGITAWDWATDPQGINQGGNNLSLIPRDMAKIGQLYLDNGTFRGQQLISKWWIDESTKPGHPSDHEVYGDYGFLWYTQPKGKNAFVAVGYGGQYIYVSRPDDCVIVVTSTLTSKGLAWEKQLFDILQNGILKSLSRDREPLLTFSMLDNSGGPSNSGAIGTKSHPFLLAETITRLNLRKGPDKYKPALTTLETGEILRIREQKGPWFLVRADEQEGWVHADFIRIISSVTGTGTVANLVPEEHPAVQPQEDAPSHLRTALRETERRAGRLQDLLQASDVKLSQAQDKLAQLEEKWRNQEKAVSRERIIRRNIELERDGLLNLVASLEGSLQEKDATAGEFQKKIAALEKQDGRQKDERTKLQTEQKILTQERDKERNLRIDLERKTEKLDAEIRKLIASRDKMDAQLADSKKETAKDKLAREKSNKTIAQLRDQIASLEGSLQKKKAANDTLQQSLAGLQQKLSAQEKLTAQLNDKHDKLAEANEAEALHNSDLLKRLTKSEKAEKNLTQELATFRKKTEASESKNKILLQELAASKDSLNKELIAQKQRTEKEKSARKDTEQELVGLRSRIASLEESLHSANATEAETDTRLIAQNKKIRAHEKKATIYNAPDFGLIDSFVNTWATNWSQKDVSGYLANYSLSFQPSAGLSRKAWAKKRNQRLAKPSDITIQIDKLSTKKTGESQAKVTFNQHYRSNTYSDLVSKTLVLQWEENQWKIMRETSVAIR